jgi:putative PIN family toxin of toxin-antitoxin system
VRAVLDTNCVISGFFWRGPARSLLDLARAQQVEIFTSSHLIAELASVLARPKFEPKLKAAQVRPQQLVQGYIALAQVIRKPPPIYPVCRDPNDDQVLACALAAQADLIVSGDKDLLVLRHYRGIPIFGSSNALTFITAPPVP